MVPFISAIFYLQVQWMVIGEAGGLGPSVPRAVVEELKQEGDSVTTKPTVTTAMTTVTTAMSPVTTAMTTVTTANAKAISAVTGLTAIVATLKRDGATLTPVQVNTLFGLQDMTKF